MNSSPRPTSRSTTIATYVLALLLGLSVTAYTFPLRAIFATDIRDHPPYGMDAAVGVMAQRYFTKDEWRWPPLMVKTVGDEGVNVGFTDGVPLIEIVVKAFRGVLPPDFHSIYLWLAICWIAQPMAAVFALRSAGEHRLLPNLAVAILAVSMPTLLFRFVHAALSSHFLILIALGLYFRITRDARMATVIGADALMLVALLTNPYIMYMVLAVLAAAPLSLLVRRDRRWIPVGAGIVAGIAITGVVALILGYGHAVPAGGFGYFSMNLLSPVYRALSLSGGLDATGGQYEGFQYLGMGLILLVLVAIFCLKMPERLGLLRRHAGLVLACLGLTLLALSTRIYAGNRLLLDLGSPSWLELRSSGRMFWPVSYTLLIAGTIILCRKLPYRWAATLLLVLACLQYVESSPMRRQVRHIFKSHAGYAVNTALLRPLLAAHSRLVVWPKFGCGGDPSSPGFSELFLLASEAAIPVNTAYVARFSKEPECRLPEFPITVGPEELWAFVPRWTPGMVVRVDDWQSICRQSGELVLCAQDLRHRSDLPVPKIPLLPLGEPVSTVANSSGLRWLLDGWYEPEPWATWSQGPAAQLAFQLAEPVTKPLVFSVTAGALAAHPATSQKIAVLANGRQIATWDVKEAISQYQATIPVSSAPRQSMLIEFHVEHPISPSDNRSGSDPRKIGFALCGFRLDAGE